MRADPSASVGRRPHLARWVLPVATLLLLLSACRTPGQELPVPIPTSRPTPRPFTVMSTDLIRVTDPAAITDAASTVLSLNVFQRLMTAERIGRRVELQVVREGAVRTLAVVPAELEG